MNKISAVIKSTILVFGISTTQVEAANVDQIKMLKPILGYDKRAKHKDEVVNHVLEASLSKYGPYQLTPVDVDMTTGRALKEIRTGGLINVFIAPSSPHWEDYAIPIKTPIRQGLLSYRLLLINKDSADKFTNINNAQQLSNLTAGLQSQWITSSVFKDNDMNFVYGHEFERLFLMLNKNRFDYIPRAVYEIYDEYETRKNRLANVMIEPTIALYVPMATYIYVSRSQPELAERMDYGLTQLAESGKLKEIFDKYYADDIERARIHERKLIRIDNPNFNDKDVLKNKKLWTTLSPMNTN